MSKPKQKVGSAAVERELHVDPTIRHAVMEIEANLNRLKVAASVAVGEEREKLMEEVDTLEGEIADTVDRLRTEGIHAKHVGAANRAGAS